MGAFQPPPPTWADAHRISIVEAASFLECSTERVLGLLAAGTLPGIMAGRGWVIPRAAFLTAVNDEAMKNRAASSAKRGRKRAPRSEA
jgi:excisionase family DNA binding protein